MFSASANVSLTLGYVFTIIILKYGWFGFKFSQSSWGLDMPLVEYHGDKVVLFSYPKFLTKLASEFDLNDCINLHTFALGTISLK